MQLEMITKDLVLELLNAIVHHEDLPSALFDLHFVKALSDAAQGYSLKEYVVRVTYTALMQLREEDSTGDPALVSYEVARQRIAKDFRNARKDLQAWSVIYHRYLCGSTLRVKEMAQYTGLDVRQINECHRRGLELLAEQMRADEAAEHTKLKQRMCSEFAIRPSTARLFGRESLVKSMVLLLTDPVGPLILSLSGMGGVGKTSLAVAVVNQLVNNGHFSYLPWIDLLAIAPVSFQHYAVSKPRPEFMFSELLNHIAARLGREDLLYPDTGHQAAATRDILRSEASLIVLDNFDHTTDPPQLARQLHDLAGPSRFLLVGRRSLRQESYIHSIAVQSLAADDSMAFLRYQLEQDGREMGSVTDEELGPIHTMTGGLPQALQLVASQLTQNESLITIQHGLTTNSTLRVKSLMASIYERSWRQLSPGAQDLLLHMRSISANGEDREWLGMISGLDSDALGAALTELVEYHLVQVGGPIAHPSYRLHPLTLDFLNSDLPRHWRASTR